LCSGHIVDGIGNTPGRGSRPGCGNINRQLSYFGILAPIGPTAGLKWALDFGGATASKTVIEQIGMWGLGGHLRVDTDSTSHLVVKQHWTGTALQTATIALPSTLVGHVDMEFNFTLAASGGGSWEFRVDGDTYLSGSAAGTTKNPSYAATWDYLDLRGGGNICDIAITDGSGFLDFFADDYIVPTSAGSYTDGTPNTGTILSCLDDSGTNDGTTTRVDITSSGLPKKVSVTCVLPSTGVDEIRAVQSRFVAKKNDAGVNAGRVGIKTAAGEANNGADLPNTSSFQQFYYLRQDDPGSPGTQFTPGASIEAVYTRTI
jgi:hypothetical protein